jgi:hypothetical protein
VAAVRCGINTGEVIFPEEKAMEEISDEVVDVAGHMQKYATHQTLWMAKEVLSELTSADGFVQVADKLVDGRIPFEWRPEAEAMGATSAQ